MRNCKEYGNKYKSGNFNIYKKKINSLDGCPQHITGWFRCDVNYLTSLVGGPQIVDDTYDCNNNQLTDLEGCASHISGSLMCTNNNITSLLGIHKIIKSCIDIYCDTFKITEGGIGLLLIDNLRYIPSNHEPFKIIRKYLGQGTKGLLICQNELINEGYPNHAKL